MHTTLLNFFQRSVILLLTIFILVASAFAQKVPNDIRPGAVLVFPYYTSNSNGTANTMINIFNVSGANTAVHLLFMDGATCVQSDMGIELTVNGAISFSALDMDPMMTGYLIAVGIDDNGNIRGGLTGNAFVKTPAGYFGATSGEVRGNYNATTFQSYGNNFGALNFDGVNLDAMPTSFAAEIQNPNEAPGQTIVMAGMKGSISDSNITGAANTTTGQGCNEDEVCRSFSKFLFGKCHSVTTITPNYPNMPFGGPAGLIKPGQVGTLKFSTAGGVGLIITPRNNNGWSGIRSLSYTRTNSVKLEW